LVVHLQPRSCILTPGVGHGTHCTYAGICIPSYLQSPWYQLNLMHTGCAIELVLPGAGVLATDCWGLELVLTGPAPSELKKSRNTF
jgi:hypothetical protein